MENLIFNNLSYIFFLAMKQNLRFLLLAASSALSLSSSAQEADMPLEAGRYTSEWASVSQWNCPEWFKDAKFGIWAHWGPQCEAEDGDWYARFLYYPGTQQWNWQTSHFGSPKDGVGLKDLIHNWKADQWNPDELVKLYKEAGARYFMALGNHHDNFDLWNSPYQPWNSCNMGPKKDLLGGWSAACKKYGLPLGVSIHASHAWTWLEPSQPYDGNLMAADGKGTWWDGYDPQDLYAQNHPHSTGWDNSGTIHSQWAWGNGAAQPSAEYMRKFQNRVLQVVRDYDPQMLYFDDTVLPFYGVTDTIGLNILADFYNTSMSRHGGKNEAVVMGKILDDKQKESILWDVERGIPDRPQDKYWQTCTCIGDWHYSQGTYNANGYKPASQVIRMLVDIVSKNGNLLLNIPIKGNGTIDEKERAIVEDIGRWMNSNGQSIYGTRTWKTFGEGPLAEASQPLNAQGFNEGNNYSSADVRYVERRDTVFATIMVWPEAGNYRLGAFGPLAPSYSGIVDKVELLGHGPVSFRQDADGLYVDIPATRCNDIAPVLQVTFGNQGTAWDTLQQTLQAVNEKMAALEASVSENTGKRSKKNYEALDKLVDEALACKKEDGTARLNTMREALAAAYQKLANERVGGSVATWVAANDMTKELLVEANHFSRSDQAGTRYGTPKYWTVENYNIPDGSQGIRHGIDNYPGYNCLNLGVWDNRQDNTEGNLANARIYRKVRLLAGRYFFGATLENNWHIPTGYIYAATDSCATANLQDASIASCPLQYLVGAKSPFGITFTIDQDQEVILGFQADLASGYTQQEFRVSEVKLLRQDETVDANDITEQYLVEASGFTPVDGADLTKRFTSPKYWTVENFNIPQRDGSGTKGGLDKYPGFYCLYLGLWGDGDDNTAGNNDNCRIYRRVMLPKGTYKFGLSLDTPWQLPVGYMFVSGEPLATADIPSHSLASKSLPTLMGDGTFNDITFTLDEPAEVLLGFQADLTDQHEMRVKGVRLLQAGDPMRIGGLEDDNCKPHDIYDLSGRKINHHKAGVYVVNRHKIVYNK